MVFQRRLRAIWRPRLTASHLSYTSPVKVQCKATVKVHGVFPSSRGEIASSQTFQLQSIYNQIIKGIQKYFKKAVIHHAVVGVSGGVDSALTLKLAVDALGPENVTAISMPELGVSSQENIDHAKALCHALNVTFFYQPINPFLTDFYHLPWLS